MSPVAVVLATVGSRVAQLPGRSGLSFGRYGLGVVSLTVVLVTVRWAAVRIRRRMVPWTSAPARLAEIIIGLGLVTGTSFAVGGLHGFAGWLLFLATVVVALTAGAVFGVGRHVRAGERVVNAEPTPRSRRVERFVALIAVGLVGAQWVSHTAYALGRGMTEGDTLWYHGVFAARFVQTGRLDIFPEIGAVAQGYFPATGQMFHALAFFPFDRDLLSPLLNLVFAALVVLAAFCVGRRRGLGAMCVIAATVALGLPALVGTHPGQGTNDVLCATFLLAALALLVEGELEPASVALAGVAAALSLGTKLTVAVPLTVLTVSLVVIAIRRRQLRIVFAWLMPLVMLGAFWFVRNWVRADNPLPWYDLTIGPLHLPVRNRLPDNASIASYLFTGGVWARVWHPGLHRAFGALWPVVIAAPGFAALLMLGRGRRTAERVVGAVALAAGVGYILMPFTMELGGAAFAATARYASPALLIGLVLTPVALRLDRAGFILRASAAVFGFVIVIVNASAPDIDRYAPWRSNDVALAIAVVVIVMIAIGVARLGGRVVRTAMVVPCALVLVFAGFGLQRHYLTHRYAVGTGLRLDAIYQYASTHEPMRIVAFGTIQFSPLLGPSFANRVIVVDPPGGFSASGGSAARCAQWSRAIGAQHPTYVVDGGEFVPGERPDARWFRASSALTPVAHTAHGVLYRVHGRFTLGCSTP